MIERFTFALLSWQGGRFLRSVRPMTLAEIQVDAALSTLLKRYPHEATTEGGEPLVELPGFPQARRKEPA